jgi:3-deoxy-manno-octulosonate cytidylyltransferase (CMP-KDO synthetase)
MEVITIIPARYASQRFPSKPLVMIKGSRETHSLIYWTWTQAKIPEGVKSVYIATDSSEIKHHAESFGAKVIMTSEKCRNGTERCYDAMQHIQETADVIVNFQGDSPLTPSCFVENLMQKFHQPHPPDVVTPALQCNPEIHKQFTYDQSALPRGTFVVFNNKHQAMYFSKSCIPFLPQTGASTAFLSAYHHVGLYAYNQNALANYVQWETGALETIEGLEQLRFLENGFPITIVLMKEPSYPLWEVNIPGDEKNVEAVLNSGAWPLRL